MSHSNIGKLKLIPICMSKFNYKAKLPQSIVFFAENKTFNN